MPEVKGGPVKLETPLDSAIEVLVTLPFPLTDPVLGVPAPGIVELPMDAVGDVVLLVTETVFDSGTGVGAVVEFVNGYGVDSETDPMLDVKPLDVEPFTLLVDEDKVADM